MLLSEETPVKVIFVLSASVTVVEPPVVVTVVLAAVAPVSCSTSFALLKPLTVAAPVLPSMKS